MLPDLSGEEVCRRLRARSRVPIIMLTAKMRGRGRRARASASAPMTTSPSRSARASSWHGSKPCCAVPRTWGRPRRGCSRFNGDDLLIDDAAGTVRKAGATVSITPREFRILRLLAGNPGRVFSREELIARALGDDFDGFDRTIDAHVKNLRQKIETDPRSPRYIHTVHGIGYRFNAEEDPP